MQAECGLRLLESLGFDAGRVHGDVVTVKLGAGDGLARGWGMGACTSSAGQSPPVEAMLKMSQIAHLCVGSYGRDAGSPGVRFDISGWSGHCNGYDDPRLPTGHLQAHSGPEPAQVVEQIRQDRSVRDYDGLVGISDEALRVQKVPIR